MDFEKELQMATAAAEETIENFLPTEVSFQKPVTDAMNYSVLSGGKRIRPILMAETYKLFALPWEDEKGRTVQIPQNPVLHRFMAGIEFIHNYSLVHDDLPAMDNDDMRRGQETTHKKFGEALGILAGDALLNYAFEMMAKGFETDRICEACMLLGRTNEAEYMKRVAWALSLTAQKAGIHGMIGGQTADVCDEGKDIGKDELLFIYENKTAALIEAAMMDGAILGGASEEDVKKIGEAAGKIGHAFQIRDDLLDEKTEKPGKITFLTFEGAEKAEARVASLTEEAIAILSSFEKSNDFLLELTYRLMSREK